MYIGVNSIKTKLQIKPSPDLLKRDPELGGTVVLSLPENIHRPVSDHQNFEVDDEGEEEQVRRQSNSDEGEEGHDMLTPLPPVGSGGGSSSMYHIHSHNSSSYNNTHHFPHSNTSVTVFGGGGKVRGVSESDSIMDEKMDPTSGGQRTHFGSFYLRIGAVGTYV